MNLLRLRFPAVKGALRVFDPRAIIALSLLAASAMLIGAIAAIWTMRAGTLRDESTRLTTVSVLLAEQTARAMDAVDLVLRLGTSFAQDDPALLAPGAGAARNPETARRLGELIARTPQIRALAVVDAEGRIRAQTGADADVDIAPVARGHLQAHANERRPGPYLGRPAVARDPGGVGLPISRRFDAQGGRFRGVVIASITPGYFEGLYRAIDLGASGRATLARIDGAILASRGLERESREAAFDHVARWIEQLGEQESAGTLERAGEIWYVAGVARVPGSPLIVATEIARDELLARWWRLAAFFVGGALLASAAVVGFGWRLAGQMREGAHLATRLRSSEDRLHAIIESAMDAIVTTDAAQRIVLFNTAAERLFGLPAAEAIGGPLDQLLPARYRRAHAEHVDGFGATGTTTRQMGGRTVLYGLRADGSEFPIDASISQVTVEGSRFYTVILRDVTARVEAEAEILRTQKELADLSRVSQEALEEERRRVARELHDELGQSLTAIKMDMQSLQKILPADLPALGAACDKIRGLVDDTVAATRRISSDLRPLMLDDLGLGAAVDWLVQGFSSRTGIHTKLTVDDDVAEIGEPAASVLFRIVQESLTNIARHAGARNASVAIERDGDQVVVRVADDGKGISAADRAKPGSFGLRGIRERTRLLGGTAEIASPQHGGAVVTARIPLAAESARQIA